MSRDLNLLEPAFKEKINFVLGRCNTGNENYQLKPFFTLRTPEEQARLWRQSRASAQIRDAVSMLKRQGAHYLADCMVRVGPQYGRWATNALPGQSWHQWGLAIDCFILQAGKAVWNGTHEGYQLYATTAESYGLHAGKFWRRSDTYHVQFNAERVTNRYGWLDIDQHMQERFNG